MVVILAACSIVGDSDEEGELSLGSLPTVRDETDIVLPLDAYFWMEPEQRRRAAQALNLLGRECMDDFGFDWNPPTNLPQPSLAEVNGRRYGILDADMAASFGYRASPEMTVNTGDQSDESVSWYPTDAELAVWNGSIAGPVNGQPVPEGGCVAEATRAMVGDQPQPDFGLVQRLKIEAFVQAENDSRVQTLFDAWAECMQTRGYRYNHPSEPSDQFAADEQPTEREINTAVADVRCRDELDFVATWMAVEIAYHHRAIEEHGEELAQAKEYLEVQARNVARVLGGG